MELYTQDLSTAGLNPMCDTVLKTLFSFLIWNLKTVESSDKFESQYRMDLLCLECETNHQQLRQANYY